jgi:prepilin-type processing-associated H-X9-DG protein
MKSKTLTQRGLSLVEVFLVLATIALLALFFLPPPSRHQRRSSRIGCVNHLKQIGLAYRLWSNDHGDQFPFASTNTESTLALANSPQVFRHYALISNELNTPKLLVCPVDQKTKATDFGTFCNTNLSYFVGLDAREDSPNTILSGDRNIVGGTLSNGFLRSFTPASNDAGWTSELHNNAGNVGLGDGSVQQLNGNQLRLHLASLTNASIRLAIP